MFGEKDGRGSGAAADGSAGQAGQEGGKEGEEEDWAKGYDAPRHVMFEKGQSKRIWGELFKVLDSSDVVIQVTMGKGKERGGRPGRGGVEEEGCACEG